MHYFYTSVKMIKYFYVFYNALCNTICILYLFFKTGIKLCCTVTQTCYILHSTLCTTSHLVLHHTLSCLLVLLLLCVFLSLLSNALIISIGILF